MPVYNATPSFVVSPQPGDLVTVWNAETPVAGTGGISASQQVALGSTRVKAGTPFAVDGKFSGAPGAFEVDVQGAQTDADANYQTLANGAIITVDTTNNTFHFASGANENVRFVRLLMRSRTNAVSVTATIKA